MQKQVSQPLDQWEKRLPDSTSLPEGISAPAMLLLEMFSETALPECVPDIYIQLEQWHCAFSKLLQFSRTPEEASTYVAATTLYIQTLSLEIPLRQYHNFNVVGSDHSIVAILDVGRTIAGHSGFLKLFVFDTVTILAIWMIVALCPNIDPKKVGLELFRAM
jgi:hypothetical protein